MASLNLETEAHIMKNKLNIATPDKIKRPFGFVTSISLCLSIISIILVVLLFITFYGILPPKFEGSLELRELGGISKRNSGLPPPHNLLHQMQPGLEAIKLVGELKSIHMNQTEYIAPWEMENEVTWANLSSDKTSVVIQTNGLYFVYAQIYYFTNKPSNSFQIEKWAKRPKYYKEGKDRSVLSLCASPAPGVLLSQVSCYTGVIAYLQAGDMLRLFQIQRDRVIHLSSGYSHWGVLRLQNIYEK